MPEPLPHSASTRDLLAELDRRATALRDRWPDTSQQVCPDCSTIEREIFGTWDRQTSRFHCEACGIKLQGDRYEARLEDFYARRWRERKAKHDLDRAARDMSRWLR